MSGSPEASVIFPEMLAVVTPCPKLNAGNNSNDSSAARQVYRVFIPVEFCVSQTYRRAGLRQRKAFTTRILRFTSVGNLRTLPTNNLKNSSSANDIRPATLAAAEDF